MQLLFKVDGAPRLSIVVDHRSGELEVRDLQSHVAARAAHDRLDTGLHKALFKEVHGAAAQELLAWRAKDMLSIITGLAPALGLLPTTRYAFAAPAACATLAPALLAPPAAPLCIRSPSPVPVHFF